MPKYPKYLIFLITVALVTVMFSGCTNSTPATVPMSVSVSTPTQANDPIIGVWRYSDSTGYDDRYHFYADGTFVEWPFNKMAIKSNSGKWNTQGNNSYTLRETDGTPSTMIYIPGKNAIYDPKYPNTFLTPYLEDTTVATAMPVNTVVRSTPVVTYISSSTSPTTLSGSGDDVVSFTATGTGLRIFTMKYTGTSNFIVVLKDGSGGYITGLANEIGSYSGKTSEQLSTGKYYLDVKASGPWSIQISS